MCAVNHGYGRFGGCSDGSGGWYAYWTKPWGYSHFETCRNIFRVLGDILMTHAITEVRNSVLRSAGIGHSSWKGINAGRQ